METRAEERRRVRAERRVAEERTLNRLWEKEAGPSPSPSPSPATSGEGPTGEEDVASRLERVRKERAEKRKQEEDALNKQAEDRAKAREERRKKMAEEEKEHEARMEERRKQREDRKKAITEMTDADTEQHAHGSLERRESFAHLQKLASGVGPSSADTVGAAPSSPGGSRRRTMTDGAPAEPEADSVRVARLQRLKEIGGAGTISDFKSAVSTTSTPSNTSTVSLAAAIGSAGGLGGALMSAFGGPKQQEAPARSSAPTTTVAKKRKPRINTNMDSVLAANFDRKFDDKNKEKEKEAEKEPEIVAPPPRVRGKRKGKKAHDKKKFTTISGSNPIAQFFPMYGSSILVKSLLGVADPKNLSTTGRAIPELPMPRRSRLTHEQLFTEGIPNKPNLSVLKQHLVEEGRLEIELLKDLILAVKDIFKAERNVLQIKAPVSICGDIHGQFYDLIALMEAAGDPASTSFLFLGDYVDRGCFSTEVCIYLCACKLLYPTTFFMLRGNHESRQLAEYFNFKTECKFKYEDAVYDAFMDLFDHLPLAALVSAASCGPFFCVHGGLSPFVKTLADIDKIDRFIEPPYEGAYCDLLWADPLTDQYDLSRDEHTRVTYLQNTTRGCSYYFGYKAAQEFLQENGIASIVRAHEVQQHGYSEYYFKQQDVIKEKGGQPPVITVFSAPNYCDMYQNKAAYLLVNNEGYSFKQIAWSEHPAYLPNFSNGIAFSLPVVLEQFASFCLEFLKKTEDDDEDSTKPARDPTDKMKEREEAIRKIMVLMRKMRKDNEGGLKQPVNDPKQSVYDRNLSVFERALKYDRKNEVCRPKDTTKMYKTL